MRRCVDQFSTSISLRTCSSLICNTSVQFQMKIRKISLRRSFSPKYAELGHFTLLFCRGRHSSTVMKCPKIYNARAQSLFCSLNLLFCGVLIAVAVVVCLRSLFRELKQRRRRRGRRLVKSELIFYKNNCLDLLGKPMALKRC